MAVVRGFQANFAEATLYKPFLSHYDVTFFYTGPKESDARRQFDQLGLQGIRVCRYRGYTDFISNTMVQRALDYKVGLGSLMLSHLQDVLAHDVVNLVDPIYAHAGQIVPRLRPEQKLVYVMWENIVGRHEKIYLTARQRRANLARGNAFLCVSDAAYFAFRHSDFDAVRKDALVTRIYPGVLMPSAVRAKIGEATPTIVFAGRPQWSKGLDYLLAAFAMLRQDFHVDAKLCLIGIDPLTVQKKVAALGITDDTEATGRIPNQEVRERMLAATAYCFPSMVTPNWSEQFGYGMVEAMAHGLPVVACDSGSIREICGEGGIYASTGNSYSLATALRDLLLEQDRGRARGERLRKRAHERYDAELQGAASYAAIEGLFASE
jgi:glycosyltransferase involved in cell wall biosynthesis